MTTSTPRTAKPTSLASGLPRRQCLLAALSALCVAAPAGWGQAYAQGRYPDKTIKLVVPYVAGSATDVLGRVLAERLSTELGQSVIVENRPGAGSNLATGFMAKAPADGYQLLLQGTPFVVNPHLYRNPGYDALKDFVPLATMTSAVSVLVVHANSPVKDLRAWVQAGKAAGTQGLTYATSGNGTPAHLAGAALCKQNGIACIQVPYKGASEIVSSVIGEQASFGLPILSAALGQIRSGRLRALAVTGARRNAQLPDTPTLAEALPPGFALSSWSLLLAPAGTPAAVVQRLNEALEKIVRTPAFGQLLGSDGTEVFWSGSPAEVARFVQAEHAKWALWVQDAGVKLD